MIELNGWTLLGKVPFALNVGGGEVRKKNIFSEKIRNVQFVLIRVHLFEFTKITFLVWFFASFFATYFFKFSNNFKIVLWILDSCAEIKLRLSVNKSIVRLIKSSNTFTSIIIYSNTIIRTRNNCACCKLWQVQKPELFICHSFVVLCLFPMHACVQEQKLNSIINVHTFFQMRPIYKRLISDPNIVI